MGNYEAFGRMESDSWSDSSRVQQYAELFAIAADQAIAPLVEAAHARIGYRALDLCCGQGNVARALGARGCKVTGLDFSSAMLEMARKREPDAAFVEGDAQNLPFQEGQFDTVVSNFGICHVPDQPRALAEAHRVLRPGGHFAMTVWCGPAVSPCFEMLYGAIRDHGSDQVQLPAGPDFHQFSRLEVAESLLGAAGFSDVRMEIVNCSWELERPDLLCEIFEKATARASHLFLAQPREKLLAIRSAVATAVRNRFRAGTHFRVPIPAALVSGRK